MKIAAFVDADGNTLPLDSSGMVQVYEYKDSEWYCIHKVPFYINKAMNLADIRSSIYAIAPDLNGCRAFVVKRSMGIFSTIFEQEFHIRVFQIQASLYKELLDQVRESLRLELVAALKKTESCKGQAQDINPVLVGEPSRGCYTIDLIKVQEKHETMNSKEILLPFFQNNKFVELEIVCLHTPKWLERELTNFNFRVITETRKDGLCHAFVRSIEVER